MTITILFLFLFVYKALFFMVVWPVGRFIWTQALFRSPAGHITNNNMTEVFGSPVIWGTIILLLLGLAFWTLLEISVILTGMDRVYRGEYDRCEKTDQREECDPSGKSGRQAGSSFSVWRVTRELVSLMRESICNIGHVLRPGNFPVLIFTLLIFPFTDLLLASRFISQFVSLKYILRHIMGSLFSVAVFWAVVMALILWIVEWLFVFHYFILERCSFAEAVHRSMEMIRGHQVSGLRHVVWRRFAAGVEMYFVGFLGAGAAMVVSHMMRAVIPGISPVEQFSYRYIYLPVFVFIYSCVMTFVHYDSLTTLYHGFLYVPGKPGMADGYPASVVLSGTDEPSDERETGEKTTWRKRKIWSFHREGKILAGGMAVVIMAGSLFTAAVLAHTSLVDESVHNPVEITAHRGYSSRAPENTMPAFRYAIECGKADFVELDVQETADGILVLAHDVSLKRCTGRNEKVSDLTYDELSALDASRDYRGPGVSDFSGVKIPTLQEVMELCKGRIGMNIEVKGTTPNLTEKVVQIIKERGMKEECMISSSRYSVLKKVKELEPDLKCGYIMSVGAGRYYDLPAADFFSMEAEFVTREIVNELHLRGKEIHVWTVNQTKNLEKMLQLGVDNIITDEPERIFDYIEEVQGLTLDEEFFLPVYDIDSDADQDQ